MCDATSTPNGHYGFYEACHVTFAQPVLLHVHLFDLHWNDELRVDPSWNTNVNPTRGSPFSGGTE